MTTNTKREFNTSEKIVEIELEEILLKNMPIGCNKQKYIQGFDYETITSKNM